MIRLGHSRQSTPSALKIAEASGGRIVAVRSSDCDVNWGRRHASGLNADTTSAVNKRQMRELFKEHGVPAPQLYDVGQALAAFINPEIDPPVLVGRPDFHTRGRGFWLCRSLEDVERSLRGTRRKMAATHFMDFVDIEREFRCHVFNGKSIRISEKRVDPDDPTDYTTVKPTLERRKHLRRAAREAVAALGLDFGTVDLFADEERAVVLEVNTGPGLGGSMPRVWAETFINHFDEEEDDAA